MGVWWCLRCVCVSLYYAVVEDICCVPVEWDGSSFAVAESSSERFRALLDAVSAWSRLAIKRPFDQAAETSDCLTSASQ